MTNKTDKNSNAIRAWTQLQTEQLPEPMPPLKRYVVTLTYYQISHAIAVIAARSLESANEIAAEIESDEIDDWDHVGGKVSVINVNPIDEGLDND